MTTGLLYAVEQWGDECAGLGLNNLIDKIHVYFLNRVPAFSKSHHWSWKRIGPPFMAPIHSGFVVTEKRTADGDLGCTD